MTARVVTAGGGVAALEAAIALDELAGDRVEVAMYSPREEFFYRPFAVSEPYGHAKAMHYEMSELAARCGATFHRASIGSVDAERSRAYTHDGAEIPYDYLLVACGTRLLAGVSGAVTFWGIGDDSRVLQIVTDLCEGRLRRVAFTMPGGGTWALPIYELALLAEAELAKRGVSGASLVVVTPEDAPLQLFGRRASERVAELLAERGIETVTGTLPVRFEAGALTTSPRGDVAADAVLSLPRMEGRRIGGVPHDIDGFVPVDEYGRVQGMSRTFAAGDVANFPVKQGGIATQQTDVIATVIAAELGVDVVPEPLDPVLRGVLWTGSEPLYLEGYLSGAHGESSLASDSPPWHGEERDKIVGRYLTPFLAGVDAAQP